jgi:hypothetical protein
MITLAQYVGPHADHPDWTPECRQRADNLLQRSAALEVEMARGGVAFPDNPHTRNGISGRTLGGFRPQDCAQGAPASSHKTGEGLDRYDPRGEIDAWCMTHQDRLAHHGIYIEHASATPGWSHWTTRAPRSGNRVFYP